MTERRQTIARGVALGDSVQQLAQRLGLRPQGVRRHLSAIFDETGTWSQPQLVGWCVAHGLVTVEDLQKVYGHGSAVGQGPVGQPEGPAAQGAVGR